ncbi:MAG: hypothetical protein IPO37_23790 [Saprospiraceae bacterium]|nr:hypothetical protein [Saprospiraceae bacterium]
MTLNPALAILIRALTGFQLYTEINGEGLDNSLRTFAASGDAEFNLLILVQTSMPDVVGVGITFLRQSAYV